MLIFEESQEYRIGEFKGGVYEKKPLAQNAKEEEKKDTLDIVSLSSGTNTIENNEKTN